MKELDHFDELLTRKLSGELGQAEEEYFQGWLKESPENELHYRRMHDAYSNAQMVPRVRGQNSTFERISKQLDFEEDIHVDHSIEVRRVNWRIWYSVAAVFVCLVALSILFYSKTGTLNDVQQTMHSEMIVKTNPPGQKTRIILPDGSVCWLNSDSEISYLSNFTSSARDIYLKGEAYFEVAKDKNKAFRVHSPSMIVTALGTIFNVNSYKDYGEETVALVEGKISVECKDNFFAEVLPGEMVSYSETSEKSVKSFSDVDEFVGWKNGILQFDEVSFTTIFSKLRRWYGINLTINGTPPSDLKYKAIFKNEMLVNVLESLRYGHGFEYQIDGKNVKIMFN